MFVKRLFDVVSSLLVLLFCWPIFVGVAFAIAIDSRGGVFYKQIRVGKKGVHFGLLKFRTMRVGSDKTGQLTVGEKDNRITGVGYILRKTKLDEIPQLLNILLGDMSVVGPRPEVPKYVAYYNKEQQQVLSVKPGLTDYASIEYLKENELLAKSNDPEKIYIEEIMPAKLALNLKYIREQSLLVDLKIIVNTILKIFKTY
jgi:lipopolysaccharide/colanic/teichoic acid biosynthesis glycosyltransferase